MGLIEKAAYLPHSLIRKKKTKKRQQTKATGKGGKSVDYVECGEKKEGKEK